VQDNTADLAIEIVAKFNALVGALTHGIGLTEEVASRRRIDPTTPRVDPDSLNERQLRLEQAMIGLSWRKRHPHYGGDWNVA
jgi:hypothetical protein